MIADKAALLADWDAAQEAVTQAERHRAYCFEKVLEALTPEEIVEHVTHCNLGGPPEKSEH